MGANRAQIESLVVWNQTSLVLIVDPMVEGRQFPSFSPGLQQTFAQASHKASPPLEQLQIFGVILIERHQGFEVAEIAKGILLAMRIAEQLDQSGREENPELIMESVCRVIGVRVLVSQSGSKEIDSLTIGANYSGFLALGDLKSRPVGIKLVQGNVSRGSHC